MWWEAVAVVIFIGIVFLLFRSMFFPSAQFLDSVAERRKKALEKRYGP